MSTLNISNITDGTDTVETGYVLNGSAKAWAKYGMDDNTINDSLNLSSITDNGTGDFTNTWTNGFNTASYSHMANGSIGTGGSSINKQDFYTPSASAVRLLTAFHNGSSDGGAGTAYDYQLLSLLCHGDLA